MVSKYFAGNLLDKNKPVHSTHSFGRQMSASKQKALVTFFFINIVLLVPFGTEKIVHGLESCVEELR